jgi:hypothetical protein
MSRRAQAGNNTRHAAAHGDSRVPATIPRANACPHAGAASILDRRIPAVCAIFPRTGAYGNVRLGARPHRSGRRICVPP